MHTATPASSHAHTAAHEFLPVCRTEAFFALLAIPAALAAEPPAGQPAANVLPRPAGAISPDAIDVPYLRAFDEELIARGTRLSLSSWDDPHRGVGCARDRIRTRYQQIAKDSGGRLQVSVDSFDATSPRTSNQAAHFENIVAILPADSAPGAPHRVRVFSGGGREGPEEMDSPSRELALAVEEIAGRDAARLLGIGGYAARESDVPRRRPMHVKSYQRQKLHRRSRNRANSAASRPRKATMEDSPCTRET
jgi:hypothetical protein